MSYYLALLFVFAGLGFSVIALWMFLKIRKEENEKKALAMPFKEEYKSYLNKTAHYPHLPREDKEK